MHVAIIMDGNGRWSERRGLGRTDGHRAGARSVRRVVEAAARSEVDVLTLYAFSSDNWRRPAAEVASLMLLLKCYLQDELAECVENGIRVSVIGRRDRLSGELVGAIQRIERQTECGSNLTLQLAVDYSARDAIVRAATFSPGKEPFPTVDSMTSDALARNFSKRLARIIHSPLTNPAVDLLIRTGGERRLSDFLLWECAYAELLFVDLCWPDFDELAFARAIEEFYRRERRFGGLPAAAGTGQSGGSF